MKTTPFLTLAIASAATSGLLVAEEGGSGRYAPGALSSMYDFPSTNPGGAAVVPQFSYYVGDTGSTKALPIGAHVREDVDVSAFAAVLVAVGSLPQPLLGGTYSAGVVIPWVSVEVSSKKTLGPFDKRDVDHRDAFGDLSLLPCQLTWKQDLNSYALMISVVAPTGAYDKNALANTGKNFWTLQPSFGFNRTNPATGRTITAYAGMEINTKNDDTDYRSGETFHIDGTFYQQFAGTAGDKWALGLNAFFFQQITGDSGSGAVLGDNKGRVYGIGPALGWEKTGKDGVFTFAELKWLPELDATNRTQGQTFWLKLGAAW